MSRTQLGWLGGALLLIGLVLSFRTLTHAADPQAATSPHTWPPGQVIFEQSDAERNIRDALQQPTEFQFLDTQLGDVVAFIEKKHDVTVLLDTEAMSAQGRDKETPITKSLRNTTLGNALHLILDELEFTTLVKNDALLITTKAAASQPENLSTRTYQVHDLVVAANDPTASQPDFDSLVDLITSSIRQSDWADNGGTIGVIKRYNGPGTLALVITHDEGGHREIELLLKSLRAARLQPIYDAQAKQPLPPRPKVDPLFGVPGTLPDEEAATKTTNEKPAMPDKAKGNGGGFF